MKLEPSTGTERIMTLDVIRGFALLGILLANMAFFKTPAIQESGFFMNSLPLDGGVWDVSASLFIDTFILGKFYPMFSLLFGLGFYLFYERANSRELDGRKLFKRRLVFLLGIGLIHLVLIWSGDILFTYAIAGFALLLFVNRTPKVILAWGISLIAGMTLLLGLFVTGGNFVLQSKMGGSLQEETRAGIDEAYRVMSEGGFAEILLHRLDNEVFLILSNSPFSALNVLGIFLIGLYMGKKGWFRDVEAHMSNWKKLRLHAGWSGIILTALFIGLTYDFLPVPYWLGSALGQGLNITAGPLLMLFYVSAAVLYLHNKQPGFFTGSLAAVGRMALTNYLLQSIIAVFLFFGYGFGLFGSVGAFAGMLTALGIYVLQVIGSRLWLQHFRQGPMEALWRKWTYSRT